MAALSRHALRVTRIMANIAGGGPRAAGGDAMTRLLHAIAAALLPLGASTSVQIWARW